MNSLHLSALLLLTAGLGCQTPAFVGVPTIPSRGWLVHDPSRGRTLVFENYTRRIWEWDGAGFRLHLGVAQPSNTTTVGACVWDPARRSIVSSLGHSWDGANWNWQPTPTGSTGGIAYDEARHRLVCLFGSGSTDVAEWDGLAWTRIRPPASPGVGGGFTYDPLRGACVLASGNPPALWQWDGTQWLLLDANGPTGVWFWSLLFDPGHQRLVALGVTSNLLSAVTYAHDAGGWSAIPTPASFPTREGSACYDGVGILHLASVAEGEGLWRLEGNVWRQMPVEFPRVRRDAAVASWPTRPGIVMFGGATGSGSNTVVFDDTWVRDGAWAQRQPAHSPAPRHKAGLAWSPNDQAFVLFGGRDAANALLTDTWRWDGSDWLQLSPLQSPNDELQLVTDPTGGVLGLRRLATGASNSQWQWNGTTWANAPSHGAPNTGAVVVAGYDVRRNIVAAAVASELWEWDGAVWTLPSTGAVSMGAVYRPDTQRMAFPVASSGSFREWDGASWTTVNLGYHVFTGAPTLVSDFAGGRVLSLWHNQSSTTAWTGVDAVLTATPASAQRFGFGCAIGGSPGLSTDGRPTLGEASFGLAAEVHSPQVPCVLTLGFSSQGMHLGGGCVVWIAQPPAVHFLLADAAGSSRLPLPIPNSASLFGTTILAQLGALDPGRSPIGSLTLTDGLQFTIGD